MRRLTVLFSILLITLLPIISLAAGDVSVGEAVPLGSTNSTYTVTVTWTSSTGEAADGTTSTATDYILSGLYFAGAETIPGTDDDAPDSYALTVVNAAGLDLLGGNGAGRSATVVERALPATTTPPVTGAITIHVTGAGSANKGTIVLHFQRAPGPGTSTISTTGLATSTKQSDGSQKTQIVDGTGNVIGATSNALDVNVKSGGGATGVEQGSTTSGQVGPLNQGAVTTGAPTYTTGKTYPLSLTTDGSLRASVTNLTTDTTVGSTLANAPTAVAGTDSANAVRVPLINANRAIVAAFDQTTHGTTDKVAADLFMGGTAVSETAPLYVRTVNSLSTYKSAVANGTTDVALVAADANNFTEVGWLSCSNTSATTGTAIKLCDGACSTTNWIMLPCPDPRAATAVSGLVSSLPPGFAFRTAAKNTAVNFVTTGALTTEVTISVLYRKVAN